MFRGYSTNVEFVKRKINIFAIFFVAMLPPGKTIRNDSSQVFNQNEKYPLEPPLADLVY
jgi:hypothetical protein